MADKEPQPLISGKQLELLKKAVEIEQTDAKAVGMVGYQARLWAQVSLPYRDPGTIPEWVRRNGSLELVVNPGVIRRKDGTRERLYPYGIVPRLLLTWMATETVRLGERELSLGPSLAAFMREIGFAQTGGARVRRLQEQVQRLASSSMVVTDGRANGMGGESFTFADSWNLWWTPKDGPNEMLWPSTITLSEKYYQSIKAAPIPIDLRALGALRAHGGGGLPIDLYTWLAHRMSYLRSSTLVPWNLLMVQFGSQYTRERDFKAELLKALAKVKLVYSTVKVTSTDDGLLLSPSPTPISARR
ncbi:MAG: replication protein RepA [Candidatus Nanopelagicales bacterium]